MARKAELSINGQSFLAEFLKVDRKKIYGWSTVEVFDEQGSECRMADLAEGCHVLPSGSSALVTLNTNGETVSKSTLIGVDAQGNKVQMVPSIYDQTVMLREADMDEYFSLAVKSVYQLKIEELPDGIMDDLKSGKIYYFIFNYRADYEGDDAYLLSNGTDVFAITGKCSDFEFMGLNDNEQELIVDEEPMVEEDMDFAMF